VETSTASRVTPLRDVDLERAPQPPSNTEAEQALLGAILVNNAAYGRVAEFLAPEHFGNAVHGRIFAAIGKLIERGQIANPVTLKNLFDQDGALAEIGGAQYLARLAESAGFKSVYNGGFVTGGKTCLSEPLLTMTDQIGTADTMRTKAM